MSGCMGGLMDRSKNLSFDQSTINNRWVDRWMDQLVAGGRGRTCSSSSSTRLCSSRASSSSKATRSGIPRPLAEAASFRPLLCIVPWQKSKHADNLTNDPDTQKNKQKKTSRGRQQRQETKLRSKGRKKRR